MADRTSPPLDIFTNISVKYQPCMISYNRRLLTTLFGSALLTVFVCSSTSNSPCPEDLPSTNDSTLGTISANFLGQVAMSDSNSNLAKGEEVKGKEAYRAGDDGPPQGCSMHKCPSTASFRTATPDSTFGFPLQQTMRASTRDPAPELKKCASSASVSTMIPEPSSGHVLCRVPKHAEKRKGSEIHPNSPTKKLKEQQATSERGESESSEQMSKSN